MKEIKFFVIEYSSDGKQQRRLTNPTKNYRSSQDFCDIFRNKECSPILEITDTSVYSKVIDSPIGKWISIGE